jgi:general secretion pathway protein C
MQGQIVKATQEWASLLTNLQWQKVMRLAPKWLALLMVILVAKSAADLTWLLFAPSSRGIAGTQHLQATHSRVQVPVRLRTVSDLHLFGVASKTPVQQAPIEAKKTHLKLTLRGVFAATNSAEALAIIADARGKEKVYRKGDTIFSGVKLYAVYPDRVILERSGNFESLSLPRNEDEAAAKGIRMVRPSQPPSNRSLPVVTRTVQGGPILQKFRQQILQHPQEFYKNMRIEPVTGSNNQVKGYTFNYNDPKIMNAIGLRPNDIIVAVDGQPASPSVLSSLLSKLSTATSISLGIERNGQRENININM